MKKTLVISIIMVMVMSLTSIVKAATTVTATLDAPATVVKEEGAQVTATVSFSEPVDSGRIELTYDHSVLSFASMKSDTGATVESNDGSGVYVRGGFMSTLNTITVTFNVIGEIGSSSELSLAANNSSYSTATDDDVTVTVSAPKTVTVIEKQATPPTGGDEDTGDGNEEPTGGSTSSESGNNGEDLDDQDQGDNPMEGKKEPTEIIKTGSSIGIGVGLVAIVALVAKVLVAKKN